jgi:hypothetical protein
MSAEANKAIVMRLLEALVPRDAQRVNSKQAVKTATAG